MEGGRGNQQKSEWAGREHGQKYYCEKKGWPNPAGPRGVSPKERTKTMVEAGVAAQPRCKQDRGPRGLTSLCGCGPNGAPLEHVTDNIDNIPFYPPLRQNCLTLGGESPNEQNRNEAFPRTRAPRRSQGGSDMKAPVRPGHYDCTYYTAGIGLKKGATREALEPFMTHLCLEHQIRWGQLAHRQRAPSAFGARAPPHLSGSLRFAHGFPPRKLQGLRGTRARILAGEGLSGEPADPPLPSLKRKRLVEDWEECVWV